MLEQVLMNIRNWFPVKGGIYSGTFTIKDGGITLPFLADGQYFRICGSVFNDGLHQYNVLDLTDETFTGTIWALAIPKAVIELADEIQKWQKRTAKHLLAHISQRALAAIRIPKQPTQKPAAQ